MPRRRIPALTTSSPDSPPPKIVYPTCRHALDYRQSILHAMAVPEHCDQFARRACGVFEYRRRTRKLRRVDAVLR